MTQFSFLTCNIERRKHLDRVIPFLKQQAADTICLQEIFDDTFDQLKQELEMHGVFAPRLHYLHEPGEEGVAILSRYPIEKHRITECGHGTRPFPELMHVQAERPKVPLLQAMINGQGSRIHVATTHFTWASQGGVSDEQRTDLKTLLDALQALPDILLAGDFNAPRGTEIFDTIAQHYQDNIPPEATTTLDPNLHRAGKLDYVVDGLFTSPEYKVDNVQLHSGLSDHFAITAQITKLG